LEASVKAMKSGGPSSGLYHPGPDPAVAQQAAGAGFTGPYTLKRWRKGKIREGSTAITPATENPSALCFSYKVFLADPAGGVRRRLASFQTKAAGSGVVSFDYQFDIFHSWYDVEAVFEVFTKTQQGPREKRVVDFRNLATTGPRTFTGSESFEVSEGCTFGFRIGGDRFNSCTTPPGTGAWSMISSPAPLIFPFTHHLP